MKIRMSAFVQHCCRIPRFSAIPQIALIFSVLFAVVGVAEAATQTTTLTISGQNNVVISGLTISTTSGDCIDIVNSTNVTITASQIGPCGTNNSTANSRGIAISGGGGINIYDSYIHVDNIASSCSNSHDGIYIESTQGPVAIRGNVIAYNETHIEGFDASDVTVDGNSLINTRGSASCSDPNNLEGHGVQFWRSSLSGISNITMTHNYLLDHAGSPYNFTPSQSDGLSCGHVTGCYENNNYVVFDPVGGKVNIAACGIIAESGSTVQQLNNVISQAFNGGTCVSNSDHVTISGNKIELKQPSSGTAGGIIVEADTSTQCHDISTTGNTSYAIQSSGYVQGYWASSNCTTNVTQSGNTLNGSALAALDPIASTNPPPLIPPLPFACVAPSPYSTQTSAQSCSGSGSGSTPPPPPPPPAAQPTAAMTASPSSISSGQSAMLTWSSTNTTSCSGAGFTASGISGSANVAPAATSTYSITCAGSGGSASASATVTLTTTTAGHGKSHKK
jgi:hypothetical protein